VPNPYVIAGFVAYRFYGEAEQAAHQQAIQIFVHRPFHVLDGEFGGIVAFLGKPSAGFPDQQTDIRSEFLAVVGLHQEPFVEIVDPGDHLVRIGPRGQVREGIRTVHHASAGNGVIEVRTPRALPEQVQEVFRPNDIQLDLLIIRLRKFDLPVVFQVAAGRGFGMNVRRMEKEFTRYLNSSS
jgi:hypothetical protein